MKTSHLRRLRAVGADGWVERNLGPRSALELTVPTWEPPGTCPGGSAAFSRPQAIHCLSFPGRLWPSRLGVMEETTLRERMMTVVTTT